MFCDHVDFFHGDSIDFVVAIQTLDVFAVPLDHVNEVVDSAVVVHEHIGIVDLVLREDVFDHFFVEVAQRLCAVQLHAAQLGGSDGDLRWIFI